MRNFILTFILILCFHQTGKSQSEPLVQKYARYTTDGPGTDFWKTAEREYVYDSNDNLVFKLIKGYSSPSKVSYWNGGFYEYDSNNRLSKYYYKKYNPDVDLWITSTWKEYKYDPRGCLIEESTYVNVGGYITGRITYTRNENCQMTSEYTEWLANGIELKPKDLYIREYLDDGKSYDELFYRRDFSEDTLYLSAIRKYIIAESSNTLEYHQTVLTATQDTFYHSKVFYDYDEFDNVILGTTYFKYNSFTDWELTNKRFHHNYYDENGFLVEKQMEEWSYDEPNNPVENLFYQQSFNYENTCEGIVQKYDVHHGVNGKDVKYEFVYRGLNECIDLENVALNLTISPNPTLGELKIFSPIFKTGNTDILVFSTDGKVLLETNEKNRCESSEIDLSHLHNGIYILQLQSGDYFTNQKVVIAK